MRLIVYTGVLVLAVSAAQAQGIFSKKALQNESMNHFLDASEAYQGLYTRGSREASIQAARNLYKARRYEEALPLYEYADSLKIISDADEVFRFFECLKSVKRYEDADKLVRTRISDFADRPEFGLHDDRLNYYNKLSSYKGVELKQLGLNSKFSDMSPTVYDGWLYFVSTRPGKGNNRVHRINMQPFYNLYAVPLEGDMKEVVTPRGDFGEAEGKVSLNNKTGKSLPEGINKRYHDGPIRVASSGNILFFTSNYSEVKRPKAYAHRITLMIYYSEKKDGVWSEPKGIPSNSFEYSNQHAYYDEGTSSLYFTSNRPGGKGGYDIWKSVRKSDGSWGDAENLGDKVNTGKAEVFPSLTPDGQLLFASNGWPGLGGLDMFMSEGNSKEPLNLLAGINSEKDDFGLYFTDRNSGYLGSNRDGSVGDDDIWSFTMEWDVKTVRQYNAPDGPVSIAAKDAGTKQPIGVQLKIRQEGISDRTVAAGPEGSTINLTAGDEITFTADGYEPVMVKVTEEMLDKGNFSPALTAIPDYKSGTVAMNLRDPQTGAGITGDYTQWHEGRSSDGTIPATGSKAMVHAGDKIQFVSSGYDPVTIEVTEDMIRSGSINPELVRSPAATRPTIVTITGNDGRKIGGQMIVSRKEGSIARIITAEGGELNLQPGDRVTISSSGYVTKTITLGSQDLRKGALKVDLKADPSGKPAGSPVMIAVKDAVTGKSVVVAAQVSKDGTSTGSNIAASGSTLNLMAGSELTLTASGYEPVTVRVTEEMIANGKFTPLMRALNTNEVASGSYGPIYYAYRKWDLSASAQLVLNKLIQDMNANPQMKVELRAYADCRGNMESNVRLSEQRLESAIKFVQSRITNPERITGRGLGESVLVNDCACEGTVRSICGTAQHGLNRRTEFVIISR